MQAKQLMEADENQTVQDVVNKVGISRSAFYKYKDYISCLGENKRGRIMTIAFNLRDEAGLLSNVLNIIARHRLNILTINQTIPINEIANVTISVDIGNNFDVAELVENLKTINGVMTLKIIARE
jgi:chorismate mutase